jgi:CRISPR-associated endonuclease/helicase Cas3
LLWIRFLYSCLVDADRLDSEAFGNPEDAKLRSGFLSFDDLNNLLNEHLKSFSQDSEINRLRKQVLDECNLASGSQRGIFSLTVPTGLGKTLSSISFAIKHAIKHNLDRVIIVIPYTSIIDQTSAVFESVFGSENVIEHHSNLDLDSKKEEERRKELIQDTWNERIIVTTSVQFLETMFSNRASRCRKLHNICNSVIIFDEAQLLPVVWRNLLVTSVFSPLVNNYGCSIVLSTATQPAFGTLSKKLPGLEKIKEIINDVPSLYKKVVRVNWNVQKNIKDESACITVENMAARLANYDQVLAVVNSRSAARKLANALQNACGGLVYHLSATMCQKHRKDVIAKIKEDLSAGRACRVVSTQLIEAGVDIDFPVVFRDACGLDSLIQSAGRCNREGKLERGEMHVVRLGEMRPDGSMKEIFPGRLTELVEARKVTFDLLEKDLNDLGILSGFYPEYYMARENSIKRAQVRIKKDSYNHDFESVGRAFKVIDTKSESIIISGFFREADETISQFRRDPENKKLRKKLQKYSVSVYPNEFNALRSTNAIEELIPDSDIWITKRDVYLYDEYFGLLVRNLD